MAISEQLSIEIRADDKASAKIRNLVANLDQLKNAAKRAQKQFDSFKQTIDRAFSAAVKITGVLYGSAAASTYFAAKVEKAFYNARTMMQRTEKQADKVKTAIVKLSRETGFSLEKLSDTLYTLGSAGIDVDNATKILQTSAKAAVAGATDINLAFQSAIGVINAYGLSLKDITKIYAMQFEAVKKGLLTYQELARDFGMIAPSARSLGVSLREAMAGYVALTTAGIASAEAANAAEGAFQDLMQQVENFAKLGIKLYDKGRFVGLLNVVEQLRERMKDMTDEEKTAFLQQLHLSETGQRALLTWVNNYEKLLDVYDGIQGKVDALNEAFELQKRSVSFLLGKLRSALETLNFAFFNAIRSGIVDLIKILIAGMTKLAEWIDKNRKTVSEAFWAFVRLMTLIIAILGIMKLLNTFISGISKLFSLLANPFFWIVTILGKLLYDMFKNNPKQFYDFMVKVGEFIADIFNFIRRQIEAIQSKGFLKWLVDGIVNAFKWLGELLLKHPWTIPATLAIASLTGEGSFWNIGKAGLAITTVLKVAKLLGKGAWWVIKKGTSFVANALLSVVNISFNILKSAWWVIKKGVGLVINAVLSIADVVITAGKATWLVFKKGVGFVIKTALTIFELGKAAGTAAWWLISKMFGFVVNTILSIVNIIADPKRLPWFIIGTSAVTLVVWLLFKGWVPGHEPKIEVEPEEKKEPEKSYKPQPAPKPIPSNEKVQIPEWTPEYIEAIQEKIGFMHDIEGVHSVAGPVELGLLGAGATKLGFDLLNLLQLYQIMPWLFSPLGVFGYAEGGFTGFGSKHEPAGIVHKGEYVIPAWMVEKYPRVITALEKIRRRGYAEGGGVDKIISAMTEGIEDENLRILSKSVVEYLLKSGVAKDVATVRKLVEQFLKAFMNYSEESKKERTKGYVQSTFARRRSVEIDRIASPAMTTELATKLVVLTAIKKRADEFDQMVIQVSNALNAVTGTFGDLLNVLQPQNIGKSLAALKNTIVGAGKGLAEAGVVDVAKAGVMGTVNIFQQGMDAIGGFLTKIFQGLIPLLGSLSNVQAILDPIATILQGMMNILAPVINQALKPFVTILSVFGQLLGTLLLPLLEPFLGALQMLGMILQWIYNTVIVPIGRGFYVVFGMIASAFNWLYNVISDIVKALTFGTVDMGHRAVKSLEQIIKEANEKIQGVELNFEEATTPEITQQYTATVTRQGPETVNVYQYFQNSNFLDSAEAFKEMVVEAVKEAIEEGTLVINS